jgi:hypothetical protein
MRAGAKAQRRTGKVGSRPTKKPRKRLVRGDSSRIPRRLCRAVYADTPLRRYGLHLWLGLRRVKHLRVRFSAIDEGPRILPLNRNGDACRGTLNPEHDRREANQALAKP